MSIFRGFYWELRELAVHEGFRGAFHREIHRRKLYGTVTFQIQAARLLHGEDNRFTFQRGNGCILVSADRRVVGRERGGDHLVAPERTLKELEFRLVDNPVGTLLVDTEVVLLDGPEILGKVVLHHEHRLRYAHLSGHVDIGRGDGPLLLEYKRIFCKSVNVDHTPNIYYLPPKRT